MPTIIVDGESYEVDANDNLLEALLALGKDVPYFCWHPSMGSIGSCRQCAVIQYRDEEDTQGRIVMSCMTPVTDGAILSVDADNAKEFRSSVIENLMTNHPHDCPVCEEGGECQLQDMTVMAGHNVREFKGLKTTHKNQYLGPLISHEMNRCIACYRCVRYYNDYAGGKDLSAFASRSRVFFGRHEDGVLESEFAGNLVEVCPTGVFTDKPLSQHYTRKWDLQSAPSICTGCSIGCNISASERYGELRRIHNRYNADINGYFLCDRGRFGGSYVNNEGRIPACGEKNPEGLYVPTSKAQALDKIATLLTANSSSSSVVGIGSPRASLESNHLLKKLVGADNYYTGMSSAEDQIVNAILSIQQAGGCSMPTLKEVEEADAVLVLGEDITNTSARLALSLRQMVRNRSKEMAEAIQIPLWNDAAVRKVAQNEKSPLMLLTSAQDKLQDVSTLTHSFSPEDIARLGFAIANMISGEYKAPGDLTDEEAAIARSVADTLADAKNPVIISGSGCLSQAIVEAAANVAWALNSADRESGLIYCVPECNTMGVAMMQNGNTNDLDQLITGSNDIEVAIVMENDLFRRASADKVQGFLARVKNLVVMEQMDNPTASASDLVLPAAAFSETEATLVNYEGRAQRSFAAYLPKGDIQGSWQWLIDLASQTESAGFEDLDGFDAVTADVAAAYANLAKVTEAAPTADYRSAAGQKIPRMTHRASGRTAMLADVTMHEPKQPVDETSALAFTMEGASVTKPGDIPASMRPHIWSPGWNSNQAIVKFQNANEAVQGVRMITPTEASAGLRERHASIPAKAQDQGDGFRLVPGYHLFGSEELSACSDSISQLVPAAHVSINSEDAGKLGVASHDGLQAEIAGEQVQMEVIINDSVAKGCAVYSYGIDSAKGLVNAERAVFKKAENWESARPSNLIKSDR